MYKAYKDRLPTQSAIAHAPEEPEQEVAKSSVTFDVKTWEAGTDMDELERRVRSIEMAGLLWGASKVVPVAFGIEKLRIGVVVEDARVSVDGLVERIKGIEELVQSVDIMSFNKI